MDVKNLNIFATKFIGILYPPRKDFLNTQHIYHKNSKLLYSSHLINVESSLISPTELIPSICSQTVS